MGNRKRGKKKIIKTHKKQWEEKSPSKPVLNEESSKDEFQEEAGWIQRNVVNYLNRCYKKITVCVRSKMWWMQEIAESREILDSTKRVRKRSEVMPKQV